jgi:hypothetical protein
MVSEAPGGQAEVQALAVDSTVTSTSRQTKRRPALRSRAPGRRPASHRTWKPLQMPRTGPPSLAKPATAPITGENRAIAPQRR